MSAPTYQFRPGGFEDEESDEDGFYMGPIRQEELSDKPTILPANTVAPESSGRGGFGTPKPKPADKIKQYRRSQSNKSVQGTKSLSEGDFQNAVARGKVASVKKYLDEGFKVDTVLQTGWTGLMYAASGANVEVMKLLLDKGADPKFSKDMYYVLMAACGSSGFKEEEVVKCVNLLLDRGAEVNVYDRYHMSPLMCAARVGMPKVIQRLVDAGANINKQDSRGWTSLTWAVSKGNTAAVRTLINAGADPNMKHCDGGTAIDLTDSDEIIALLGGEPSQKATEPIVTMSSRGDNMGSTISNSGISAGSSSSSQQYGTTYGELELFLCGLDLSQFVPLFQSQHVEFNTFLRLTEEDLTKMGISQIGVRKKILDGILAVHKKEWEKSSLPPIQYNKHVSCAESIAMVANISKHSKYITTSIGFIQDQIRKHPSIVEELQDGTGPKQLHQHLVDTQRNVKTLYSQLDDMKLQLEKILQKGNYVPPDFIDRDKLKTKGSRLHFLGLVMTSALVITVIWNRQTVIEKVWTLFPK